MTTTNQQKILEEQIISRNITAPNVLKVMSSVDHSIFVPPELQNYAWDYATLDIGIKKLFYSLIVAFMTEAPQLDKNFKVLEIGTGSGYQADILAEIYKEVYIIEIVHPLAESAKKQLKELRYHNLHVKIGDGYKVWPSAASFDVIIVTAAPKEVLIELIHIIKTKDSLCKEKLMLVRFALMVKADSYKIN